MIISGFYDTRTIHHKSNTLVDEARYPARHKDRMVHDTLIASILNDIVHGKITKKGLNITLA